jgi:hypothetical protein
VIGVPSGGPFLSIEIQGNFMKKIHFHEFHFTFTVEKCNISFHFNSFEVGDHTVHFISFHFVVK